MSAKFVSRFGDDLELRVGQVEWPRTRGEVRREWEIVDETVRRIGGEGLERADLTGLGARERAAMGVWAAAAWSTGATATAPLGRVERPVTADNVEKEASLALVFSTQRHPEIREYASGVSCWMRWICGEVPALELPAL